MDSPTHKVLGPWGCPRRGTRFGGGAASEKSRPCREKIQRMVHEKEEKPLFGVYQYIEVHVGRGGPYGVAADA